MDGSSMCREGSFTCSCLALPLTSAPCLPTAWRFWLCSLNPALPSNRSRCAHL